MKGEGRRGRVRVFKVISSLFPPTFPLHHTYCFSPSWLYLCTFPLLLLILLCLLLLFHFLFKYFPLPLFIYSSSRSNIFLILFLYTPRRPHIYSPFSFFIFPILFHSYCCSFYIFTTVEPRWGGERELTRKEISEDPSLTFLPLVSIFFFTQILKYSNTKRIHHLLLSHW